MPDSGPEVGAGADPATELAPATVTTTQTVKVTKPEIKQVSNYAGAAILGAAAYVVAHPVIVTVFIPPPWNTVAAGALSVLGAALVAYREKQTVSSSIVKTETTK